MRAMGERRGICLCCECRGADGSDNKKRIRKAQRSRARQQAKKEIRDVEKIRS